ncbi:hypothetical protein LJD69_13405, partial [Faecalibacillus faecis]
AKSSIVGVPTGLLASRICFLFPSMKIPPEKPFSSNLTFPNSAVKNNANKIFRILEFNTHWYDENPINHALCECTISRNQQGQAG